MSLDLIPNVVRSRFQIDERHHACAILAKDFSREFNELLDCLRTFKLLRSEIEYPGGRKSKIADRFDNYLIKRGWNVKSTKVEMMVDGVPRNVKTHAIDICKGRIACEVQWNSKDGVYSRDLTTFRLLHEWNIISVGVVITRSDELQDIFVSLGWVKDKKGRPHRVAAKYGQSTTHWSKLIGRIDGGDAGTCPLLLIGITKQCYVDDTPRKRPVLKKPSA